MLVVEVDGETHWSDQERERDVARTAYLEMRGWRVVRVTNRDIYDNLFGVVDHLRSMLAKRS